MEIIDEQNKMNENAPQNHWEQNYGRGKIFGGLIIIGVGCLFLAREMGAYIPSWIFTWQMLLIVIGLYTGVKHAFQNISWLILIMIGSAFLIRDYMPEYDFSHFVWPVALIIVGVYVILKPRRSFRGKWRKWNREHLNNPQGSWQARQADRDDYIDISSVFGSINKNIISKNFKGGEINCVFGGAEINLMQADIEGRVTLEVNQVFGGTRLIVPAHWEIKSELTAVLGNVEDKRPLHKDVKADGSKVLILKGSAVFGGIEIKSY